MGENFRRMLGERRTLEDMVADVDYPPEVAAAIIADIDRAKTRERIVNGELALPTLKSAMGWHLRKQREAGLVPLEQADPKTVQALQDRMAALEERNKSLAEQLAAKPATTDALTVAQGGG